MDAVEHDDSQAVSWTRYPKGRAADASDDNAPDDSCDDSRQRGGAGCERDAQAKRESNEKNDDGSGKIPIQLREVHGCKQEILSLYALDMTLWASGGTKELRKSRGGAHRAQGQNGS